MTNCCLCSNFASDLLAEPWNRPLFASTNFVVLPSLGSLVEGWVLIVPKEHFICIGALPAELVAEMNHLKSQVCSVLGSIYGELCAFEHGPKANARNVGCGVDHAHLHIVPIHYDLVAASTSFAPRDTEWHSATFENCREAFEKQQDYLYVEQPIGVGRISTSSDFGSQIFRKAIAASLGVFGQFSWREYPQTEIIAKTINTLSVKPQRQLDIRSYEPA
ncbi:MAG TPA: hypothetical protein VFK06_16690 [Candidatus Angelobacter sp.]|nr:hypothetical protein [Candidatus Angelobacter sp.]